MINRRRFIQLAPAIAGSVCFGGENPETPVRSFTVADSANLKLFWKQADGTNFGTLAKLHQHLEKSGHKPLCLMNAGIFDNDSAPLGLHVEEGKELRPLNTNRGEGNFFLEPNGVFAISAKDGKASIKRTTDAQIPHPRIAVQSGPLLVIDGQPHPAFKPKSPNLHIRNGIGVTKEGTIVLAISTKAICFHDFALHFRDVLHCPNALYLDGTISQCWLKGDDITRLPGKLFAGMLAVVEK